MTEQDIHPNASGNNVVSSVNAVQVNLRGNINQENLFKLPLTETTSSTGNQFNSENIEDLVKYEVNSDSSVMSISKVKGTSSNESPATTESLDELLDDLSLIHI